MAKDDTPKPKPRSWGKRLLKWGGIAFVGLGAAGVGGLLWLGSESGRLWVTDHANQALTGVAQIEGLDWTGLVPGTVTLSRIALADKRGDWAEIRQAELTLSPGQLLWRRAVIDRIKVAAVDVPRLPEATDDAPAETSVELKPPDLSALSIELPVSVSIGSVEIDNIVLAGRQEAALALSGDLTASQTLDKVTGQLRIKGAGQQVTRIFGADLDWDSSRDEPLDLSADFEIREGGRVNALLSALTGRDVSLGATLQGRTRDGALRLSGELRDTEHGKATLTAALNARPGISLNVQLDPLPTHWPEPVTTELAINWRGDRDDWPFTLHVSTAGSSATAAGRLGADGSVGGQIQGSVPRLPFTRDLPLNWGRGDLDLIFSADLWQSSARLKGTAALGAVTAGPARIADADLVVDLSHDLADGPQGTAALEFEGVQIEGLPEGALPGDGSVTLKAGRALGEQLEDALLSADLQLGRAASPDELTAQVIVTGKADDLSRLGFTLEAQAKDLSALGYGTDRATLAGTGIARIGDTAGLVAETSGSADWSGLRGLPPELGTALREGRSGYAVSHDGDGLKLRLDQASGAGFNIGQLAMSAGQTGKLQSIELSDAVLDLAPLALPDMPQLEGQVDVQATLSGATPAGRISIAGRQLSGLPDAASQVLGATPALAGQLQVQPAGATLSQLNFNGQGLKATGRIGWPLAADLAVQLETLAALSPRLSGAATATVKVDGDQLSVEAKADSPKLDGRPLDRASLAATATLDAERPAVDLTGQLGQAVALQAKVTPRGANDLQLAPLNLRVGENRLSGTISVDLPRQLATGQLRLDAPNLTGFRQHIPGAAALDGSLTADLRLAQSNGKQQVSVTADASALRWQQIRAEALKLSSSITDPLGANPGLTSQLSISGSQVNGLAQFGELDLQLSGTAQQLGIEATVSDGQLGAVALEGELAGRLSELQTLTLSRLDGDFAGQQLALRREAVLSPKRIDLAATLGEGSLELALNETATSRSGRIELDRISLAPISGISRGAVPPLSGTASGQVTLGGSLASPSAAGTLRLDRPALSGPGGEERTGLRSLETALDWRGNRLKITGDGQADGPTDQALPFQMELDLPMPADPRGWPQLNPAGRMTGKLQARLPAEPFNAALEELGHRLDGAVDIDIAAIGTPAAPVLTGAITPDALGYRNSATGSALTGITGQIVLRDGKLAFDDLAGTTGGRGTLGLSGDITLAGVQRSDLKATLNRARLSDSELLRLELSGQVAATGPVDGLTVTGNLTVDEARLNIPKRLPVSIPELRVTETSIEQSEDQRASVSADPKLDIAISAPGKVYLRGRGLDAELRGEIKATGTISNPGLDGVVSVKRGSLDLLGRSWSLTGGGITFDGPAEQAQLGLTATATRDDFKAIVLVTGRLSNPEFKLTSEPELPQDEILSRLLFGKDAGSLSAGEAVSLAASVAQLSGVVGASNTPLDQLRDSTGLDRLSLGGGESGGLEAGKYLTDRIYIGVEQGLSQDSSKAKIDFEITDELKLEGSVGTGQGGAAGIKWQREY